MLTDAKGESHVGRFVEYWARIGSEDNMTMCHRPTCRKEGVLLDYSTDGGMDQYLPYRLTPGVTITA